MKKSCSFFGVWLIIEYNQVLKTENELTDNGRNRTTANLPEV